MSETAVPRASLIFLTTGVGTTRPRDCSTEFWDRPDKPRPRARSSMLALAPRSIRRPVWRTASCVAGTSSMRPPVRACVTPARERPTVRTGSPPRRSNRWTSRRRTETLDAYTRRARLAPALLAAIPALAVLGASALSPETTVRLLGVALGAIGLAVCGLVRDHGRQIEPDLWASWGGNPTLRRLRWRGAEDEE